MRKFSSLFIPLMVLVIAQAALLVHPSRVMAQGCGGPIPPAPAKVWAKSGPANGEVTLYWDKSPHADRYAVAYGTKSNWYQYGGNNIGGENTSWYTVKALQPGTTYYFKLAAAHGCASSPFSSEVHATASGWSTSVAPQVVSGSVGAPATVTSPVISATYGPVGKQGLWAKSGPGVGEVTLYWQNTDSADNYHLVYGKEHGKFIYGALNIGKVTWFKVSKLTPGVTYHFALVPVMNGRALYTTDQVMVPAYQQAVVTVVEVTPQTMGTSPALMSTEQNVQGVFDEAVEQDNSVEEDEYEESYEEDQSNLEGSDETRIGEPVEEPVYEEELTEEEFSEEEDAEPEYESEETSDYSVEESPVEEEYTPEEEQPQGY